jgi:hypothetical protein
MKGKDEYKGARFPRPFWHGERFHQYAGRFANRPFLCSGNRFSVSIGVTAVGYRSSEGVVGWANLKFDICNLQFAMNYYMGERRAAPFFY